MKISNLSMSLMILAIGFCGILISNCKKDLMLPVHARPVNPEISGNLKSAERFVPNELLVKFKPGVPASTQRAAFSRINAVIKERVLTKAMEASGDEEGFLLLRTTLAVIDAVARLKDLPEVEFAEPDFIYTTDAVSNDPYYTSGNLWGMYGDNTTPANSYGSRAGEAWARNATGSAAIFVGIIDEGYMYTHEDLSANAGKIPGEIPGNNKDDDGNGYVDDVYGWDFYNNDNTVFDGIEDDHGTHVAGTIGAAGGNNKGVAGVCWKVQLLCAKFLGSTGGITSNAVKAVDYLTDIKTRHRINLVATNNSWGGAGYSTALKQAIDRANAAGILFVAAAGNWGLNNDESPYYPASYPNENVIAVAAVSATGILPAYSNYGVESVDLGAPGDGIWSTVPVPDQGTIQSGYACWSGTSMAAPHVTGSAVLYASRCFYSSPAIIKAYLLKNTTPTSSLSGKCVSGGRLNISGL